MNLSMIHKRKYIVLGSDSQYTCFAYCKQTVATFVCVVVTIEHNDCVVEHQTALVLVNEPHYFCGVFFFPPYDDISSTHSLKQQYMMSVRLLQQNLATTVVAAWAAIRCWRMLVILYLHDGFFFQDFKHVF
jgi:hypothetical protein